MDYNSLRKEELIKIIEDQQHLAKAIEAKDMEISNLQKKADSIKEATTKDLEAKHTEGIKKLTDSLAESQKKVYELEQKRVDNLNQVLFVHGDLLKTLQGVVDTHFKLNALVVKDLSGGEPDA